MATFSFELFRIGLGRGMAAEQEDKREGEGGGWVVVVLLLPLAAGTLYPLELSALMCSFC